MFKARHRTGKEAELFPKGFRDFLRQHHIADTEGRRERFGEGIHIENFPRAVDASYRGNGLRIISEFGIIIVLYDIALFLFHRPAVKLMPPFCGHDDSGRKMMGRRDMQDIGIRFVQRFQAHAGIVERNSADIRACRPIDFSDFRITGVLDRVPLLLSEKEKQ